LLCHTETTRETNDSPMKTNFLFLLFGLGVGNHSKKHRGRKYRHGERRFQRKALEFDNEPVHGLYGMETTVLESSNPFANHIKDDCGFVKVRGLTNERRIQFKNIYNGVYYVYETGFGKKWEKTAENRRGQLVTVFIRKAKFAVGTSRIRRHGWVMGYEVLNRYSVVRYFSPSSGRCPSMTKNWKKLEKLKRFKSRLSNRTRFSEPSIRGSVICPKGTQCTSAIFTLKITV